MRLSCIIWIDPKFTDKNPYKRHIEKTHTQRSRCEEKSIIWSDVVMSPGKSAAGI